MENSIPLEIIGLLGRSSRILAVTGAGISTGSGIPDFRSPDGLYATAKERYDLPYPEAIFDLGYFRKNPKPFFSFIPPRRTCCSCWEPPLVSIRSPASP